ncbi:MAG: hypothetical protein DRN81_03615 [Thermoproteota archaeon]|nr:MAG: hypothetical protein DRN81_03615 [Candidatus Korarchaeota archaeon]
MHDVLDIIREMDPFEFESLVAELVRKMGYSVRGTRRCKDGGVDVYAYHSHPLGMRDEVIIQVKRYRGSVGVSVVRELLGVKASRGADKAVIITTGSFSREAERFAQRNNIMCIDGKRLFTLLRKYGLHVGVGVSETASDERVDSFEVFVSKLRGGGRVDRIILPRGFNDVVRALLKFFRSRDVSLRFVADPKLFAELEKYYLFKWSVDKHWRTSSGRVSREVEAGGFVVLDCEGEKVLSGLGKLVLRKSDEEGRLRRVRLSKGRVKGYLSCPSRRAFVLKSVVKSGDKVGLKDVLSSFASAGEVEELVRRVKLKFRPSSTSLREARRIVKNIVAGLLRVNPEFVGVSRQFEFYFPVRWRLSFKLLRNVIGPVDCFVELDPVNLVVGRANLPEISMSELESLVRRKVAEDYGERVLSLEYERVNHSCRFNVLTELRNVSCDINVFTGKVDVSWSALRKEVAVEFARRHVDEQDVNLVSSEIVDGMWVVRFDGVQRFYVVCVDKDSGDREEIRKLLPRNRAVEYAKAAAREYDITVFGSEAADLIDDSFWRVILDSEDGVVSVDVNAEDGRIIRSNVRYSYKRCLEILNRRFNYRVEVYRSTESPTEFSFLWGCGEYDGIAKVNRGNGEISIVEYWVKKEIVENKATIFLVERYGVPTPVLEEAKRSDKRWILKFKSPHGFFVVSIDQECRADFRLEQCMINEERVRWHVDRLVHKYEPEATIQELKIGRKLLKRNIWYAKIKLEDKRYILEVQGDTDNVLKFEELKGFAKKLRII